MLKNLLENKEYTMQQGWIEQAIYTLLEKQLPCKCHECRRSFLMHKMGFKFYFNDGNPNELRVDLEYEGSE